MNSTLTCHTMQHVTLQCCFSVFEYYQAYLSVSLFDTDSPYFACNHLGIFWLYFFNFQQSIPRFKLCICLLFFYLCNLIHSVVLWYMLLQNVSQWLNDRKHIVKTLPPCDSTVSLVSWNQTMLQDNHS